MIFVTGYDSNLSRIRYQYAHSQPGAGPGGSDLFTVEGSATYSAGLAEGIQITSGGVICPPAGSTCTVQQLITAADRGFFADAAIDTVGNLRSVIERDNTGQTSGTAYQAAPVPSSSATPTSTPPAAERAAPQ